MAKTGGIFFAHWSKARIVAAILAVALAARLPFAFFEFAHHADEIWQYLEPAYRLDFGRSIVTWEYRAGIRSWLLPMLLAGPMWVSKTLFAGSAFPLLPVRLFLILLSLPIVWVSIEAGWRISRLHGKVAGLAVALAFEPILMASRALSEAIGTTFLVMAIVPLLFREGRTASLLAGLLLGLALAARLQLAPAVATLAILGNRLDLRKWGWSLLGGMAGLAVDAGCNAAMGEMPFRWMVENYRLNLVEHVSERYGTEPASWYLVKLLSFWGPASPLLLALVALGGRRQPVLLAVALVHLAAHMAVPHKEFRFIFPTVALFVLLGGIGTVDAVAWVAQYRRRLALPAAGLAALGWVTAAGSSAVGGLRDHRIGYVSIITLWTQVRQHPELCGLASLRIELATAYSYVDRAVPIYMFTEPGAERSLRAHAPAFNLVVAGQGSAPMLARSGYRLGQCFPTFAEQRAGPSMPRQACLYERPGRCTAAGVGRFLENSVRARLGI